MRAKGAAYSACSTVASYGFQYGYDRDGNVMFKQNMMNSAFSELYHANGASGGYDLFNRLTDFRRGVLSDSNADGVMDTITTSSNTVNWTMDSQGNWTNRNGATRTHNSENQITGGGLAYDANGNTTTDDRGYTLKYDAWNRLVEVKDTGGVVVRTFAYDGLNRRIAQSGQQFYYSKDWQVLEDFNGTVKRQYVWSLAYVDGLVLRDSDADGNAGTGNYGVQGSGLETRFYALQDANWNVTSVADVTMGIAERYTYDPYGSASYYAWDWTSKANSTCGWVYLHQGGRFDSVSNAYHFRNRDYSPTLGRWISEDPLRYFDGGNLYGYEGQSPANRLDYSGLATAPPTSAPSTTAPSEWQIAVAPLGQRNAAVIIINGKPVREGGKTAVDLGKHEILLQPDGDNDRLDLKNWAATVKYWWSDQSTKKHELVHVGVWQTTLNGAYDFEGAEGGRFRGSRRGT